MSDNQEDFQTDFILNDLYVGDWVLYVGAHNAGLSFGRIKKITPTGATIWFKTPTQDILERRYHSSYRISRPLNKLVKIPEDRLAPLRLYGTLPNIDITVEKQKVTK